MKRLLVIAAIALLAFGLLGSTGCSKKVARQADVSAGDYYSEEEFKSLGSEQREQYCADLADELESLGEATAKAESEAASADLDRLRAELRRLQGEYRVQADQVQKIKDEIKYFESLPKDYTVVRGDCLWNISGFESIYADPIQWPRIYRANKDQIKDPDLIYPDQVFDIPR